MPNPPSVFPDTNDYAEFFLNSDATVVQLELLEIAHTNFTKTYRIVRNAVAGVTVYLDTAVGTPGTLFEYYPCALSPIPVKDNLDSGLSITLGDLGEILPAEMDSIREAQGFDILPTVVYRIYRSDDLSKPIHGPINLTVTNFSFTNEGVIFEAKAPTINIAKTGEIYSITRFPTLRGFL